jgi:hypothetical protein
VSARVKQIRNLAENTEQDYEREKLNERIARLSGGVAIIQARLSPSLSRARGRGRGFDERAARRRRPPGRACQSGRGAGAPLSPGGGSAPARCHWAPPLNPPPRPPPSRPPQVGAQTETELKEKKLRVEDALNATKAAVEEGIVIGGGCTLLKLAAKVDAIKETLPNEEQKVGGGFVRGARRCSLGSRGGVRACRPPCVSRVPGPSWARPGRPRLGRRPLTACPAP